jgi:HMG-box domain
MRYRLDGCSVSDKRIVSNRASQPKRNLSAYNIFVADFRSAAKADRLIHSASPLQHEPEASSTTTTDVQRRSFLDVASEKWKNLDPSMKAKYDGLANQEKERYESELTQWEMVQGIPNHRIQPSLRPPQTDVSNLEKYGDRKLSSLVLSRGQCDAFVAPCRSESTNHNQQKASLLSKTLPPQTKYTHQSRRNSDSALSANEVTATIPQRSCRQRSPHQHGGHELEDTPTHGHSLYPSTFSEVSESSFRPYRERVEYELERYKRKLRTVMEENAALRRDKMQYSAYEWQQTDTDAHENPTKSLCAAITHREDTSMDNDYYTPQGRGSLLPSSCPGRSNEDQQQGDSWDVAESSRWSKIVDRTVVDGNYSLAETESSMPASKHVCDILAADVLWSELKDQPLIDDDEFTLGNESAMSSVDESVFDAERCCC